MIKEILSQKAHWQINKTLAREIGLNAAILISDLIDKEIYFDNRDELINGEWFYNTSDNIEFDTTLSYHQQKKAIKVLEKYGFIEVKLMGLPAKQHFKVHKLQLLNFFKTRVQENSKLNFKKVKNKSSSFLNEYNKNKINKNKYNNVSLSENEKQKKSIKEIFEQDGFIDFFNDYFSVPKKHEIREKVLREICSKFRNKESEIDEFKNQFFAYVKYKELTDENKHRWGGFIQSLDEVDYISLLQNDNNKNEKQKQNEQSKKYVAGRQTKETFERNFQNISDAVDDAFNQLGI